MEPYTRPLCPACGNPLKHAVKTDGGVATHVVYCAVGRCPNARANEGAEGATLEEAMAKLKSAIEEEAA